MSLLKSPSLRDLIARMRGTYVAPEPLPPVSGITFPKDIPRNALPLKRRKATTKKK